MKILVIDDMRTFRTEPDNAEVVYARTSREGLRTLRQDKSWDRIYLDHDLGYNEHQGADTIRPVLSYIEEHSEEFLSRPTFCVITSNAYAGDMMVRSLSVCGLAVQRMNASRQFHYAW